MPKTWTGPANIKEREKKTEGGVGRKGSAELSSGQTRSAELVRTGQKVYRDHRALYAVIKSSRKGDCSRQ